MSIIMGAEKFTIKYTKIKTTLHRKEEEVIPVIHIHEDDEKCVKGSVSVPEYWNLSNVDSIALDNEAFRSTLNIWVANEKEWDVDEFWSYRTSNGICFYYSKDGEKPKYGPFKPHNLERLHS